MDNSNSCVYPHTSAYLLVFLISMTQFSRRHKDILYTSCSRFAGHEFVQILLILEVFILSLVLKFIVLNVLYIIVSVSERACVCVCVGTFVL